MRRLDRDGVTKVNKPATLFVFERPDTNLPDAGQTLLEFRLHHLVNAIVAFLFASTGPVALILTIGIAGGLSTENLSSWIFIGFVAGGGITLAMSWFYKQPLAFAWTISGTAIAGPALLKYDFGEVVGAYMVTGAVMMILGVSGGFKALMRVTPQPIVMAMVAGVFLKFGILAVDAFDKELRIAGAATIAFIVFSFWKPVARILPPVLMALIAASYMAVADGQFKLDGNLSLQVANPRFIEPIFSRAPLLDLVLPLLVSVLALQNAQGISILRVAGHNPPTNTSTFICGAGSLLFGAYGSVNTCMTGPVNAILSSSGEPRFHFIAACIWAALAIAFGLLSPAVTELALSVPEAFIYIIGGLAMLPVLQQAFTSGFGGRFAIGATVTFVVTVTDLIPDVNVNLLGIGAPFWGLVIGTAASLLFERLDYKDLVFGSGRDGTAKNPGKPDEHKALAGPGPGRPPTNGNKLPDGPITVISPSPSPYTCRVLIALKEKGLAYQLVEDMTWRTGQGVSENPLSRNPLVKVGKSITLYDTRIVLDYLETICPVPPLMPIGSPEIFEVKTWEALTEGVSGIVIDLHIERIRSSSLQGKEWTTDRHTRVLDGLATAADMLGNRPNTVGDGFTRGDIALAAMLDHLDLQLPGLDWRTAYPSLASWFAGLSKRPAVAVVLKNRQKIKIAAGSPD